MTHQAPSLFDAKIVGPAIGDSFRKLDPRLMVKNPVMFVTLVGAVLTTVGIFTAPAERFFIAQLAVWLWFTVLFANFAEAMAEGRGKAQAQALRKTRTQTTATRLRDGQPEPVDANSLRKGDVVLVRAGETIPAIRVDGSAARRRLRAIFASLASPRAASLATRASLRRNAWLAAARGSRSTHRRTTASNSGARSPWSPRNRT